MLTLTVLGLTESLLAGGGPSLFPKMTLQVLEEYSTNSQNILQLGFQLIGSRSSKLFFYYGVVCGQLTIAQL